MKTTINISLQESQKAYLKKRIQADGYGGYSDYIRELIRQDQKNNPPAAEADHKCDDPSCILLPHNNEKLEKMLISSLYSGKPKPWTQDTVDRLEKAVLGNREARRKEQANV